MFTYNFGMLPFRRPVYTVVGEVIIGKVVRQVFPFASLMVLFVYNFILYEDLVLFRLNTGMVSGTLLESAPLERF